MCDSLLFTGGALSSEFAFSFTDCGFSQGRLLRSHPILAERPTLSDLCSFLCANAFPLFLLGIQFCFDHHLQMWF
jgi:hypothetical protein